MNPTCGCGGRGVDFLNFAGPIRPFGPIGCFGLRNSTRRSADSPWHFVLAWALLRMARKTHDPAAVAFASSLMSRTFAVFLILAAAGCGGGGEAGGADEGSGLLSFEQPAEGVPFTTGPVPFRLDFEPLELAFETLEVTLDGQLQEGPFLFSSSQILVTVLVEEPGDLSLIHI